MNGDVYGPASQCFISTLQSVRFIPLNSPISACYNVTCNSFGALATYNVTTVTGNVATCFASGTCTLDGEGYVCGPLTRSDHLVASTLFCIAASTPGLTLTFPGYTGFVTCYDPTYVCPAVDEVIVPSWFVSGW